MAVLLGVSGAATGGLTGLLAGAAWAAAGLDRLRPLTAAILVLLALAGDVAARRWSRLGPLGVGRQVPQDWGRLFGPRLVAVLYGARLGVGPLTILRTWTWWAAFLIGASLGPWPAAGVGAAFALTRAATTVAAGRGATDGLVMHARVQALTRAEDRIATGTAALLAVTALSLVLA